MKDLAWEQQKEMQNLYQVSVLYPKMPEFLDALETGIESDLKRCGGKQYTSGAVTLMTLHGSKGLEFPAVMIYGARRGFIPFTGGKSPASEEEERRLFYVGLTRAKEALILLSSQEPSAFLKDILPDLAVREKAYARKSKEAGGQMNLFEIL